MPLAYRRRREVMEGLVKDFERQFRPNIVEEIREYARVGEQELAFGLLCNMLFEYSVPVSQATFKQIEALGLDLGLPPKRWMYLQPLVSGGVADSPSSINQEPERPSR
jgi:hypothetical protein